MKLVFRLDDFAFGINSEIYAVHEKLFAIFESLKVPMLVGVIPAISANVSDPHNQLFYPIEQDTRHVALLKKSLQTGSQLALHGFTHQTCSTTATTEYAHQPYESQLQSIRSGVDCLARIFPDAPVRIFIPPWNSFDDLTVSALRIAGIRVLCGGEDIKPRELNEVLLVPSFSLKALISYVEYQTLEDLCSLVGDSVLVITMHSYDFIGNNPVSWATLSGLLSAIHQEHVETKTFSADEPAIGFVAKHQRLVQARLDLFDKINTGFGGVTIQGSRAVRRILGTTAAEILLNTASYCLQMLKAMRNHTRRLKNSKVRASFIDEAY